MYANEGIARARAADEHEQLREALAESESRLDCIIELALDYYWEQDAEHRFTLWRAAEDLPDANTTVIGKTPWELDLIPVDDGWDAHKRTLALQRPFRDFLVRRIEGSGLDRYICVSGVPRRDVRGRFLGYRGIARDVTSEQRDRRLLRLSRTISRILAEATDVDAALTAAIRAICRSEGWDNGEYWSLDERAGVLRYQVGWSISRPEVLAVAADAKDVFFQPGEGLVGTVWQTAQPLWVPNLAKETNVLRKDIVRRTGWQNAFLFPVLWRGRAIGVLDFSASFIPKPDDRLLEVINSVGTQIGYYYAQAQTMRRLAESEEHYASTVELAAVGIGHVDTDGRFIHVNPKLCEMLGYTREELLALTIHEVSHPDDRHITDERRAELYAGDAESLTVEKRYVRKDGQAVWVRISAALKRALDGQPLYDISVIEDVSERKVTEQRVQYLASHDELTGLPNRATFSQMLDDSINAARAGGHKLAVLFVDLDRFKLINDTLGHQAGDALLREIALRFKASLRKCDLVARLGGDEFVVLIQHLERPEQVARVARELLSATFEPVKIAGQECRVTASIGISVFPTDAEDGRVLMKKADLAMYAAKEEGKNVFQFYRKSSRRLPE